MSKEILAEATKTGLTLAGMPWVGAAVDGVSVIASVIRKRYPDATDQLLKAVQKEIEEAVLLRLPQLESRVKTLEEKLNESPKSVDVIKILDGFTQSYTQAEARKRDYVLNALINAFDPEIYEQSLTERLFAIMKDLDYGDLHYLIMLNKGGIKSEQPWKTPWKMDAYHASRLEKALLIFRIHKQETIDDEDVAVVTELGKRMNALIRNAETETT
jgi:hypothetical protein